MWGKDPLGDGIGKGKIHGIGLGAGLAIGGAVLGGLGGGGGGSSGSQTTTTEIPDWLKEYVTGKDDTPGVLPEAAKLYEQGGPEIFQGDMVADLDPMQLQALDMIKGQVGSSVLPGQATDLASSTMAGDYLGGDQFMAAYGDDIMDQVASRFGRAGRSGSALEGRAMAKEMGSVASRLYGQERDRMQAAMQMSPSLEIARYAPAQQLQQAGQVLQQQQQAEIAADMTRFEAEQERPWDAINRYSQLVYGAPAGQTSTSTGTAPEGNRLTSALGGALAGFGMGGQLGLFNKPASSQGTQVDPIALAWEQAYSPQGYNPNP